VKTSETGVGIDPARVAFLDGVYAKLGVKQRGIGRWFSQIAAVDTDEIPESRRPMKTAV
jgi:hypothetical protein